MSTLEQLRQQVSASAAERDRLRGERAARVKERTHLLDQIAAATPDSDALALAAAQARLGVIERVVTQLSTDYEQAERAVDRAQRALEMAVGRLSAAQTRLARLLACEDSDVSVMMLSIGRWREDIRECQTAIRELTGDVIEVPAVPQLGELQFVG